MPRDIPENADFYRRLSPDQVVFDERANSYRASSGAFTHHSMSVDVKTFMDEAGVGRDFCLRNHATFSLAQFSNELVRKHGLNAAHDPSPAEQPDNPYHANIIGKKTDGIRNSFARTCLLLIVNGK